MSRHAATLIAMLALAAMRDTHAASLQAQVRDGSGKSPTEVVSPATAFTLDAAARKPKYKPPLDRLKY